MERTWIIVICLVIVVLAAGLFIAQSKLFHIEGFRGVIDPNFKNLQTRFADRQFSYFQDTVGKEILVNPGVAFENVLPSVQQPGGYVPEPHKLAAIQKKFKVDPFNQYSENDKKFCRGAKHPSKLPERPAKATTACGWWFVSDPSVPSVGTLGKRDSPLFPDTLPNGGEWIWSIKEATMKEDMKRCKQITNCGLIDIKSLGGRCGFCPDLGISLPVGKEGKELYPEMATCGTALITSKDQCPKPPVEPVLTPEGVSCGILGYPSSDNYLRLYSKEECATIDPAADFAANGECLKPNGGSYSYDCRTLNGAKVTLPDICDPDENGRLTRPCLLSLAQGMGYTDGGAIVRLLKDATSTKSEMDNLAIKVLNLIGISVPDALLGAGDIDAGSAKDIYYQILSTANNGSEELYREASKWLVYGTNNFDPCNIPDNLPGPFMEQCIQREFRKAGCQPAGSDYPSNPQQFGKYVGYKWSNIRDEFRNLYNSMSSSDGNVQDEAVQKCLGVGVKRNPDPPCPELIGVWKYVPYPTYTLTFTQDRNTLYVKAWYEAGTGTADYDSNTKQGTLNLTLVDGRQWKVAFSFYNNTIYWDAGRTNAPFIRST